MSQKIKWGILGLGKIAGKFCDGLQHASNAEIYAVASRDLNKAEEFAAQFEAEKSYGSYEELLKDEQVQVVYIATPHAFHHELAIKCIEHGKAVLCEKPFALNYKQAGEMISLAREKNVFIMEALWTAFLPHFRDLETKFKNKEYGQLKSLKADFGFPAEFDETKRLFNKSLGGGSLLDIGIYPVFLAYRLLGMPNRITAEAQLAETGVDESCDIKFHYDQNIEVELTSTFKEKTPTEAILEFEESKVIMNSRFHEPTSITTHKDGKHEVRDYGVENNGYTYEAEHVGEMLLNNKTESDIWSIENTLELMQLLDSIRKEIKLEY